jgi:hypothetical protein
VSRLRDGGGDALFGWYSLLEIATVAVAYHLLYT